MPQKCPRCGKVKSKRAFRGYAKTSEAKRCCWHCRNKIFAGRGLIVEGPAVYLLVDPRDSRIFYVGASVDPDKRIGEHITLRKRTHSNPRKTAWIRELLSENLRPLLVIIEKVSKDMLGARESFWIEQLARHGAPLTNCKIGKTRRYVVDDYFPPPNF